MWGNPRVMKVFGVPRGEVEVLRLPMLNQGFYNLFLAGGMVYGLVVGEAKVVGSISFVMVGAGLVLFASKRSAMAGALIQATPPAIALLALASSTCHPRTDAIAPDAMIARVQGRTVARNQSASSCPMASHGAIAASSVATSIDSRSMAPSSVSVPSVST